jgi:CRP-like cAMP-binding protein
MCDGTRLVRQSTRNTCRKLLEEPKVGPTLRLEVWINWSMIVSSVMHAHLAQGLARLGIFRDLSIEELGELAGNMESVTFGEGQRIIHAGEENTSFYVVVEGEAAVYVEDTERGLLARGSFFGEISALLSEPATADVVTRSPLLCLVVRASDLERFFTTNPRVMFRVLQVEARRLQSADRRPGV